MGIKNVLIVPHRIIWSWYAPYAGRVDGRAVTFGTARRVLGRTAARSGPSLLYQFV